MGSRSVNEIKGDRKESKCYTKHWDPRIPTWNHWPVPNLRQYSRIWPASFALQEDWSPVKWHIKRFLTCQSGQSPSPAHTRGSPRQQTSLTTPGTLQAVSTELVLLSSAAASKPGLAKVLCPLQGLEESFLWAPPAKGSCFAVPLLLFKHFSFLSSCFVLCYPRRTFCILRAATLASSSESDSLWEVELWEAELQGEEHSGEHR